MRQAEAAVDELLYIIRKTKKAEGEDAEADADAKAYLFKLFDVRHRAPRRPRIAARAAPTALYSDKHMARFVFAPPRARTPRSRGDAFRECKFRVASIEREHHGEDGVNEFNYHSPYLFESVTSRS